MNQIKLLGNWSRNQNLNSIRFPFYKFFLYLEEALPRFFKISLLWAIGLIVSLVFFSSQAKAWEINTHRELTEKAIEIVASDLNTFLINNLGLEGGLNASVDGRTAKKWMIEGSEFEDDWPRFFRHFHEPISNKGLAGVFDSSINWSLSSIGDQEWSWTDAREYYFKALTSPTKTERDKNWAKTFRALGQVMHLLQDSANPAHVRDDPHVLRDGLHDFMDRNSVASYSSAGIISPDSSMLEVAGAVRNEPFSNLFDRNVYHGSNPEVTLGVNVGITEYASANFFSDDRIAGQNSPVPPFPSVAELIPAPAPSPYLTLARLGSAGFPGARVARYTGNETLTQFLNLEFDLLGKLRLDDVVYDAYARHLIPRAVGYSAAVLNYFFRGELKVVEQTYIVRAENLGGPFCNQTPADDFGLLDLNVEIPVESNFIGTGYFYYDGSNEKRVLFAQFTIPRSDNEFFNDIINPAEIPNPVPWNLVLEGQAGPGALEPRAIISKTGLAEWHYACVH
ncbi:MAG TPA: hypothetical protein PKK23_20720 [Nitrospirales bacterium]|nr:hypothetical protein [Nitrospiraceae bacterium]HNP31483.1 hypothetical protein [Nitrospirales bacterium]